MVKYDKQYYDNLKKQHRDTAKEINDKRWKFVESIPFEVVLDYGCGCGELSAHAPHRDNLVVDSYDIGKLNGEIYPQTGIQHDYYDLVFFNDVLEHVDWVSSSDKHIEDILKRTKYVCVSIPLWDFQGNITEWKHYKPGEHLTYFNKEDIRLFFEQRGFKEIKNGTPECPPREDVYTAIYRNTTPPSKSFIERIKSVAKEKNKKRKIILKQTQSPGDVLTFTRALGDFKLSYPEWDIDVRTACPEIFENNPHITPLNPLDQDVETFEIGYPEIHKSGWSGKHFSDAFRIDIEKQLGIQITKTGFRPELWISDTEKSWINQVEVEFGWKGPFWILNAGQKPDNDLKYYHKWQEVVDLLNFYFDGKVKVVQIGHKDHYHPNLNGVLNMVGKTDLRQLIRLAYWSEGLIGPLSFQFVLGAALGKPGVVIAGGKEGVNWHLYPNIRHLYTNGAIDCCSWDGCWLGGGKGLCKNLVNGTPKCFNLIKPHMIADAVKMYYEGGMLTIERDE